MASYPYPAPFPQPPAQATYPRFFPLPLAGSVNDIAEVQDFITGLSLARIPFGVLVADDLSADNTQIPGANSRLVKLPTGAGDITHPGGIAVRTGAIESTRDGLAPAYQPGDPINVMRAGRVWVTPETAVTRDGDVYARITVSGGSIQLGAFRADADGGNAILVPGARFKTTTTDFGPNVSALIEFNFLGL